MAAYPTEAEDAPLTILKTEEPDRPEAFGTAASNLTGTLFWNRLSRFVLRN